MMKTFWSTLLVLAMSLCVACKSANSPTASALTRDLAKDEAAGGHTLARHVGKSDDDLRERLSREHISAASTYADQATAESTVGSALAESQRRIQSWVDSRGGHPNLVLDYDAPQPIGRTLHRGQSTSVSCSHALVVLKYEGLSEYYVLTSYPECK